MNGRYRNWVFTDFDEIPPELIPEIGFLCFQRERCPDSGRLHWQGYLELKNPWGLKNLKTLLKKEKLHLEPRRGTQEQAIEYCRKVDGTEVKGTYTEYGLKKRQGCRSDLDSMVEAIENGMTSKEILLEFRGNGLRHLGMIERGLYAFHGMSLIDDRILRQREEAQKFQDLCDSEPNEHCTEVTGNTEPVTNTGSSPA